ncbi:uncharacterized protein B0H18DRAFT_958776 [Fomitopsis serialis]|uniref:uncharacterized protein n=1 Tax=Fomitopsis serialis TaxID=139415 RepID=UPI00200863C4|nr:uncharacterized protein B0H18DRAFT_958776 [Neoantrodia serialis]KAH9916651.1 hypothetical protein B0H18DRAFT_958776 [Neoantrodia serialis]
MVAGACDSWRARRGALLLVSWALTRDLPGSSWRESSTTDMSMPFLASEYTARGLAGKLPADAISRNAWITPAGRKQKTCLLVGDVREEVTYREPADATRRRRDKPQENADSGLTLENSSEEPEQHR